MSSAECHLISGIEPGCKRHSLLRAGLGLVTHETSAKRCHVGVLPAEREGHLLAAITSLPTLDYNENMRV